MKRYRWVGVLLIIVGLLIALYFVYRSTQKEQVEGPFPTTTATAITNPQVLNAPQITTPKNGDHVKSPLTIKGVVPSGWMFEGVFPLRLVNEDKKIIVQTQGKELTPGSWQSGKPVEFEAILTFSTIAKYGYVVLENDNPSGDPTKTKRVEVPVYLNCTPRPACLDTEPKCKIVETTEMCPKEIPAY